jgi:hypothetical protein
MQPDTDLAFPHLSIDQFDRYAHELVGNLDVNWQPEYFPFDHRSLPRLPEIKNPAYALRARTHRSLPARVDPEGDPELQSLNFFETIGDGLLQGQVTRALVFSGCNATDDLTVSYNPLAGTDGRNFAPSWCATLPSPVSLGHIASTMATVISTE